MRRIHESVRLDEAMRRLVAFRNKEGYDTLWPASTLADVIWPDNEFLNPQGAGAAASRVLKKLGVPWIHDGRTWGYDLRGL